MKIKIFLLSGVCMAAFGTSNAYASLGLFINVNTKEFALIGSDTGTPGDPIFGGGIISFSLSGVGGGFAIGDLTYNNDVAFTTDAGPAGNDSFGYDVRIVSSLGFDDSGQVSFSLGVNTLTEQTIQGSGIFQSYASLDSGSLSRFESVIGQSLPLVSGTGFDSLSVVPEPSSYAILSGLATLGFTFSRRSRNSRK